MSQNLNLKKFSFLVYGLGSTGESIIKFFKKNSISNFYVWDDKKKLKKEFDLKNLDIKKVIKEVDYIVLSPGISLKEALYKKELSKFKKKIITDIDLLYLSNSNFKSIVVTGSNGKSTTCKLIYHLLQKNKYKVALGGNIGTPVLNLKIKKNTFFVIEASSFQLSHSKFIKPNYAILLNITNDHLDWHGSMGEYVRSKFKIFKLQTKNNFALINKNFVKAFNKKKYLSKLITPKFTSYEKIKLLINNNYLSSKINDENMSFVFSLSKLLKIKDKRFISSMKTFIGLPHRHEIFLKKKNITFINDSKATSFQATNLALSFSKNIFWIVGGRPKKNDKINLNNVKNNVIKSYIIGKHTNFFKKRLKNKIKFSITKNLKNSIISIIKDLKPFRNVNTTILLSPGAASFDQFKNFETRGDQFKKMSRLYAKKLI